jgi:hypothetical protein
MGRKRVPWLVGLGVVLFVSWYFLWSGRTPKGQPPLTYIPPDNPAQFKQAFDGAADKARMVLLLSPT